MASRLIIAEKKKLIKNAVRSACRSGIIKPDEMTPPLRQLAQDYALSKNVVAQVLQELVEEGLLYTIPRVGTFAGNSNRHNTEYYLLLLPESSGYTDSTHLQQIRIGFEGRIAQLGGATLAMTMDMAMSYMNEGSLPPFTGIFDFAYQPEAPRAWKDGTQSPMVSFYGRNPDADRCDTVGYDDIGGGRKATQQLIHMGFRRIAFLGLHTACGDETETVWSVQREQGWREAMLKEGLIVSGLSYTPLRAASGINTALAHDVVQQAINADEMDAAVCVNDIVARALLEAYDEFGIKATRIPPIISFDDSQFARSRFISSFRLPGEEVGSAAAELLSDRRSGKLTGPPVHRRIPMSLISRLTARSTWPVLAGGPTTLHNTEEYI